MSVQSAVIITIKRAAIVFLTIVGFVITLAVIAIVRYQREPTIYDIPGALEFWVPSGCWEGWARSPSGPVEGSDAEYYPLTPKVGYSFIRGFEKWWGWREEWVIEKEILEIRLCFSDAYREDRMTVPNSTEYWATLKDPRLPYFDPKIRRLPFKPEWFVLIPCRYRQRSKFFLKLSTPQRQSLQVGYLIKADDIFNSELSPRQIRVKAFRDPKAIDLENSPIQYPSQWFMPPHLKIFEHYADKYGKDSIKVDVESVDGTRPDIK